MHVATTKRRHGDREYKSHLLRQSYREGGKVRHRTLANLSYLPEEVIELVRRALRGETISTSGSTAVEVISSSPHGHVAAVASLAQTLGFPEILGPSCPERDVAFALIVARVIKPSSKAAATRWWVRTTLAEDLGIKGVGTDDVYGAMDWLGARQGAIESTLASRHLVSGGLCLYDLSSSYMEGSHCPLARRGYSRDQKKGKAQIEYGLLCDPEGRPISIEVFKGNTADPVAFMSVVETLRERFSLGEVVVVGDRGMITAARIEALRAMGGMGWVTSLRAPQIHKLAEEGALQLSLFDETSLAEIAHPDYPGERLVLCRNPALAQERARKRQDLLRGTEALLDKVVSGSGRGRLRSAAQIGVRVGRDVNRYKMAKHFELEISDGVFSYSRKADAIASEAALDGIYVVRTSVARERLSAPEVVEAYKGLKHAERAFRSLKSVDVELRPVFHRLEARVRAHALVCMLACYLVWHLRRAWAPLTFTDEAPPTRSDPVARATRSAGARRKAARKRTDEDVAIHSFGEIIDILGELPRNVVRVAGAVQADVLTTPTDVQRRAFELLGLPLPLRCV
jgi:hypothetical protein